MNGRSWMAAGLVLAGCGSDIIHDPGCYGIANDPSRSPARVHDRITVSEPPQIDILWVISRAPTMDEEQAALVDELEEFVDILLESGADWRVGVTSTDVQDEASTGVLQEVDGIRYITAKTEDPEEVLGELLLSVGTSETAVEGAFEAVQTLVEEDDGFYRHDASLNVLLVSDQADGSADPDVAVDFAEWAQDLKPRLLTVTWSSVVGDARLGCRGRLGEAEAAPRYLEATDILGGAAVSICLDRWDVVMRNLGARAQLAPTEYLVSGPSVPGTLEVWVEVPNGDPKHGDYFLYDGVDEALMEDGSEWAELCPSGTCIVYGIDRTRNSIVVTNWVPPKHSIMNIRYELAGDHWE